MSVVEYSEEDLAVRALAVLLPAALRPDAARAEDVFRADSQGRAIARRFEISYELMMGPLRWGCLPRARRELYIVLKRLGWSYPQIARFAKRDHTTIIHAIAATPEARRAVLSGQAPGQEARP
jgi:chromosomal replication initiation ATPase DnaA